MTNLFQLGDFVLNSGAKSRWKLECDALTPDDIKALAVMIAEMVGPFGSVEGVPRGGLELAEWLKLYRTCGDCGEINQEHREQGEGCYDFKANGKHFHLLIDDVLTTGGSMVRSRYDYCMTNRRPHTEVVGAVVFARGKCPPWVKPLFQMPECLWVK